MVQQVFTEFANKGWLVNNFPLEKLQAIYEHLGGGKKEEFIL